MSRKQATPEEVELVKRNLELVAHIKSSRKAAKQLGVSAQKVIDWRKGHIPPLREPMPSKLSSNLRERRNVNGQMMRNGKTADRWAPLVDAVSGDELRAVLVEELRAIRRLEEPERMKMLYRDSSTSMIGQAATLADAIARIEAEAAAKLRAQAVLEAERNGSRRGSEMPLPEHLPRESTPEAEVPARSRANG